MEAQGGPDQAPRQGEIWAAPSAVASVISCATPPSTPPRPKRGILNRVPTSLHPLSPSTPPAQPTSTPGESAGAPAPGTDSPLKRGRRRLSLSKVAAVSPPRAGKEGDSTFGEQAWRKSKLESERATGLGDNQFAAAKFGMQMHKQQMAAEEEDLGTWDRCSSHGPGTGYSPNGRRRGGTSEGDGGAYNGPSRKSRAPSKQEFVGLQVRARVHTLRTCARCAYACACARACCMLLLLSCSCSCCTCACTCARRTRVVVRVNCLGCR